MNIKKLFVSALVLALVAVGSASAAYTWTSSLAQGSRGAQVMDLQKFLNMCPASQVAASGVGSPGMESSYFGGLTKAAVIRWQAAHGVNAIGIFGPASRAAAAVQQASATPCGVGNPNPVPQSGPVSAVLSMDNPASGTIVPAGRPFYGPDMRVGHPGGHYHASGRSDHLQSQRPEVGNSQGA